MNPNSEIGQRLHDGPIQTLTAAALQLQAVMRANPELATELQNVHCAVASVLDLTTDAIAELRQLAAAAIDPPPGHDDLLGSLAASSHALARGTLDLMIEGPAKVDLRGDRATALYLVGREAVANSVFHANGSRVVIRLNSDDDRATLEISDDGIGFDPDSVGSDHLGLRLMRDRMAAVGGELDVVIESGVCVRASVPLSSAVPA